MLGALVIVSAGGIVAGAAGSLPVLVAGRFMQGIGLGLAPIAMAAARDHLGADRARKTIAILSVSGATGLGAGYPISGLIAEQTNVHDAFYFGAVLSAVAFVAAFFAIPSSKSGAGASLDVKGAVLGGIGVVALMIAIGQGHEWGWVSPATLGCLVLAVGTLALWVRLQLRGTAPLVDLRQLRHRAVLGADVAALLLGVALYMFLTVITEFVQTPSSQGFGFGASTLVAGLCLVPFSICSLLGTRLMGLMVSRFGTRAALGTGGLAITAAGVFFALVHTALWQACVMMGLLGIGFGFTFAAIPGLITTAVPAGRDRQRDGLLPGGPLDRLQRRIRPRRLDPGEPRDRRLRLPGTVRLHHGPLGRRRGEPRGGGRRRDPRPRRHDPLRRPDDAGRGGAPRDRPRRRRAGERRPDRRRGRGGVPGG